MMIAKCASMTTGRESFERRDTREEIDEQCTTVLPPPRFCSRGQLVALEQRNGNLYYYRSVRHGERVRRVYCGSGQIGAIMARLDEQRRQERALEAAALRAELEDLQALSSPLEVLSEVAEVLARAHLVAAGCHRHKGEWRRRRE